MTWRALARAAAAGCVGVVASIAAAQPAVPQNRPASAQALLDSQPKERVEELLEERIVLLPSDGLPKGQVEALVVFEQPPDKVWELLLQRERQNEYRPELTSLAVVERNGDVVVEEQHLRIAFLDIAYRLRDRFDPSLRTMTWELDPSFESTLRHVSGYWELHAFEASRTLARFGTRVSVSSAVPSFLESGITRKNVPESLENTRQWVDSNGQWRP
jgi:hypothetical protein